MPAQSGSNLRLISDSIEKYKEIFFNLNIMVVLHDIEGTIYEVNDKFLETFGYTEEAILSLTTADLQTEESPASYSSVMENTLKSGSASHEVTLKKKNCETFPACVYTNLLNIDDNKLILCVIDDLSELKKVEKELRDSNLFLDSIIENIPDMIFMKDARDLRFVRFNKAGEELLGYSRDELIGKNDYDFFPKEEADFFTSEDKKVLTSDKVLDIPEEPIHTKEKGERTLHTKKIALRDDKGKPRYLLGISEDITERKLSEEMFRLLVESSPFAIVMADQESRIKLANSRTEKMFGFNRSELMGELVEILMPDYYQTRHVESRNQYFKNPQTRRMGEGRELVAIHKDGNEFPVEIGLTPIHTNDGPMVLASIVDITERKEAENALQKAHDELELRVIKRTADLLELNKKLKTEIDVRKNAEEALKANLEQLSKKNRHEEIINSVTHSVHKSDDLQEVLENAVDAMSRNIDVVDHVGIYFVEGEDAVMKAHIGYPDWFLERIRRIPHPMGFTWTCINEGEVIHCPDTEVDNVIGPAGKEVGTKSYMAIPLKDRDKTIGCINVHSLHKNAFDKDDIRLLETVGQQIEIALNKSRNSEALRNSEERYRTLYQENPSMYFTINEDGNVLSVNRNGIEKLGYTAEELIGQSVLSVFHEEDKEKIKEQLSKCFANPDRIFRWELRKVCKNGSVMWVSELARCVNDASGNKVALIACVDITERKKAEESKREIEERHRALVEHSYDIIVETTSDGRFSYLNPTFTELLGYDTEDVLGRDIFEFVHQDDVPHVRTEFLRVITTFDTGNAVFRFRHKNGEWRWLESSGRPFRTASGEIRASISTRDITERKRSEEALRESEERYRALVENSYDLIIEVSVDCKFLYVSPNHELVLGYKPEDLIGNTIFEKIHPDDIQMVIDNFTTASRNITETLGLTMSDIMSGNIFDVINPEDLPQLMANLETAIETHRASEQASVIYRYKHNSGEWRWLESTGRPFLTSEGEIRIVMSSRDITERKQSEDKLKVAFAEIEHLKNRLEKENIYLQEEIKEQYHHGEIYGNSTAIKDALSLAGQVADTKSTVLLQGETGTGKELMAHTIHNMSPRKDRAMITVNCATLPPNLMDNELFGHEKGAFTGAASTRPGRFEVADGSTIFLDEVVELPPELQSKLLRVLQTGQFERLGSTKTLTTNVRIIAATNRDLADAVREGSFREDLYYRLNVFPIHLPPLRDRKEDIPQLVDAFVKEFGDKMGKNIEKIPAKTMNALVKYRWPGNVRELRNVIERGVIISKDYTLHVDLPGVGRSVNNKAKQLSDLEKEHIMEILSGANWRIRGKGGAAEVLGMKPTTLESKMRRLGITRLDKTPKTS